MFLRNVRCRYTASLHRCCGETHTWCAQLVLSLAPPRRPTSIQPGGFSSKTCIAQAVQRQVCRRLMRVKGVGGKFCPLWGKCFCCGVGVCLRCLFTAPPLLHKDVVWATTRYRHPFANHHFTIYKITKIIVFIAPLLPCLFFFSTKRVGRRVNQQVQNH